MATSLGGGGELLDGLIASLNLGPTPSSTAQQAQQAQQAEEEAVCAVCEDEEEQDEPQGECCICLTTMPATSLVPLKSCTHGYCATCLVRYVDQKLRPKALRDHGVSDRHPVTIGLPTAVAIATCPCPTCKAPLGRESLGALHLSLAGAQGEEEQRRKFLLRALGATAGMAVDEAALLAHGQEPSPSSSSTPPPPPDPRAERAFREWMRSRHVKLCPNPSCNVPIEKSGGCPNMRCQSCDRAFRWNLIPLAVPCKGYHYKRTPPFVIKCKDNPLRHLSTRRRAEYAAQYTLVNLPIWAVAAPFLAAALLPYLASAARDELNKQLRARMRARRKARMAKEWRDYYAAQCGLTDPAALSGNPTYVSCRQSQQHEFVAGWCWRCGHTRPEAELAAASEEARRDSAATAAAAAAATANDPTGYVGGGAAANSARRGVQELEEEETARIAAAIRAHMGRMRSMSTGTIARIERIHLPDEFPSSDTPLW